MAPWNWKKTNLLYFEFPRVGSITSRCSGIWARAPPLCCLFLGRSEDLTRKSGGNRAYTKAPYDLLWSLTLVWLLVTCRTGVICCVSRATRDKWKASTKRKSGARAGTRWSFCAPLFARDSHFARGSRLPLFDWNTQKKLRLFCKLGLGSWTHICNTSHTVILSSNLFQSKLHVYACHHQID